MSGDGQSRENVQRSWASNRLVPRLKPASSRLPPFNINSWKIAVCHGLKVLPDIFGNEYNNSSVVPSEFDRLISGYRLTSPYSDRLMGGLHQEQQSRAASPALS